MKRTGCLALVLAALVLGCSSGGSGASTPSAGAGGNATGGTGTPSQSATGSGGTQQTGGQVAGGGSTNVGGTVGPGGVTGQAGTTGAGGGTTGAGGGTTGSGGTSGPGGATGAGGTTTGTGGSSLGGTTGAGGSATGRSGGTTGSGGASSASGGTTGSGGSASVTGGSGGTVTSGGTTGSGGTGGRSTTASSGGTTSSGGVSVSGGSSATGGSGGRSGSSGTAGSTGTGSCGAVAGVVGVLTDPGPGSTGDVSPPNPPGISFKDTDGALVNAHGGGIIRVCDTFYLHGEYFLSSTTDNDFNGFSMYSSKDLATWKKEGNNGIILPQQSGGQLGPNRKGERPHIIKCPATGEFVLYAHSADITYQADKEVVYATSPTVNAVYSFKGSLLSSSGAIAAHSDMSAYADETGAYVITESGHVFTLSSDCHSWTSDKQFSALNGTTGGIEAPTVFKANGTYYFVGSDKTGWRANDDFYSTASSMNGPWTYKGYIAPAGKKTWMTQSTWVQPIVGSQGTVFMYWGDHWYGNQDTTNPGVHNYLTTYVFQPLIFTNGTTLMPTYLASWKIDIGAGTWSQ